MKHWYLNFMEASWSLNFSFQKAIKDLISFFIRYIFHLHFKCHPQSPLYTFPALLPNPRTPTSWPWHSPVLGQMIFARMQASPPIWPTCLSSATYEIGTQLSGVGNWLVYVADTFSSFSTFSSSFIRGPVFHPIDDCKHSHLLLKHINKWEK